MRGPKFIATAAKELQLTPDEFDIVNLTRDEAILHSILKEFTKLGKKGLEHLWWWESFQGETYSLNVPYAPDVIAQLFNPDTPIWFVVENRGRKKESGNFWLYEGKLRASLLIIGETSAFEYYIVDKSCVGCFAKTITTF